MLTIALAIVLAVMDQVIVSVALPTIARELHASAAQSIWAVNAYQLTVVVALLPLAALGDKLGYRRVFLFGLALFTLASVLCALSRNLPELVAARVLQGLGAAVLMAINPALVRFTYPRSLLGRGVGLNAVMVSMSNAAAPSVAAAILAHASWKWLFAVNVPIGLLAFVIAGRALPRTPGSGKPLDWISAILNGLTFGLLILGAGRVAAGGGSSGWVMLVIGAAAAAALVRRELGRPAPLFPIDLLRIPLFGLSAAASAIAFCALALPLIAMPFFIQDVLGRSAVETGLMMTPWPLALAFASAFSGRLADRYPAGLLGGAGLAIMAVGLACASTLRVGATDLDIIWRLALCGLGFGLFQAPNNRAMIASAPLSRSGAAGGMLATARLIGQTSGAVITGVVFHVAGVGAAGTAILIAAGIALTASVVSTLRIRMPAGA